MIRRATTLGFAVLLATTPLVFSGCGNGGNTRAEAAADRAEAAANRAESAASRVESAASRTEAAADRTERLLEKAMQK